MTVGELFDRLQFLPEDMPVVLPSAAADGAQWRTPLALLLDDDRVIMETEPFR